MAATTTAAAATATRLLLRVFNSLGDFGGQSLRRFQYVRIGTQHRQ